MTVKKYLLSWICLCLALFLACPAAVAEASGTSEAAIEKKTYPYLYCFQDDTEPVTAEMNLYFMDYKNQLVLTGKYSSTGAYLTRNVPNSYRMGAELSGSYSPVRWFSWAPALTISRNRIRDYSDWISIYDEDWNELRQEEVRFGEVTIAMSPSFIFNNTFTFNIAGFRADILTSVVSRQYLDNTMSAEAVLPTYTVTNLNLEYKLPLPDKCPHIALRCQVNNVFNTLYAANGGNWMCQFTDGSRYYSPWYYPQAGINAHAGFTLRW